MADAVREKDVAMLEVSRMDYTANECQREAKANEAKANECQRQLAALRHDYMLLEAANAAMSSLEAETERRLTDAAAAAASDSARLVEAIDALQRDVKVPTMKQTHT